MYVCIYMYILYMCVYVYICVYIYMCVCVCACVRKMTRRSRRRGVRVYTTYCDAYTCGPHANRQKKKKIGTLCHTLLDTPVLACCFAV